MTALKNRYAIKMNTYTLRYIPNAKQWIELGVMSKSFDSEVVFTGWVSDENGECMQNAFFKIRADKTFAMYVPDDLLTQSYNIISINTIVLLG